MREEDDIFCLSFEYRQICDDYEKKVKAEEIYSKTKSLDELNRFCRKIILEEKAKKLLNELKFEKRFQNKTLENFIIKNQQTKEAKEKIKQYLEGIEEHFNNGVNLIIEGGKSVGTGKTHLAYALAREIIKKGFPIRFVNIISMLDELKDTFDVTPFVNVEFLFIDDFGKERASEWVFETIYGIINKRYEKMLPTIITTEDYMADMTAHYKDKGDAILSRLCEDFFLIRLYGEDYRKRKK